MARRKIAKNVSILPWLSSRADCTEGRFIQVGNSLFLSKIFQSLSAGARQLYLCMCLESGGKRTVAFPHGAGRKYGFANTTFDRYIHELREAGFINLIPEGDLEQFAPNVYCFSFEWKTAK